MKNKVGRRWLGKLLVFISIIGIIFSLFGIATTWYFKPRIKKSISAMINSIDLVLINTDDALMVLDSALESAVGNLDILWITISNLDSTIENISESLVSSADLIGGDLRLTIIDTQTALSSAAASAGLIDNTLRFLAAIPLLGADYRPDVPLSISLEQVSTSLDDIPNSFSDIELNIRETADGMTVLQSDILELAEDLQDYENNLNDARIIISEYDLIIDDFREQLNNIEKQTASFLLIASILITGGFILLGIAQITTLQQGIDYQKGKTVSVNLADLKRE
jgi:methyl-accepting chemotaxis protein